jgi:hypothetical protein
MEKKVMARLDKINLAWVLEKMSVGNLVRGVMFLIRQVKPVKESVASCMSSTVNKVKTVVEKSETEEEESVS